MAATPSGTRPAGGKPARKGPNRKTPNRKPPNRKNIVWLASYPKSGNTWVRVFLANYLLNAEKPVPLNHVHRIAAGDSIAEFYRRIAGGHYDPEDYIGHLRLRDRVLKAVTGNGADVNMLKTHNARLFMHGTELIPARHTRSAIYILRHPLDVAVSYSRHYAITPAETALRLGRPDNGVGGDARTVGQYLGNWSDHVRGWTESRDFPVHTMRYEDLKQDPHGCFAAMLDSLGVPVDQERLDRAVAFSSFEEMTRQESETPFLEKPEQAERFFHSGRTGQWEDVLAPEDIEKIRSDHAAVMKKFGYL